MAAPQSTMVHVDVWTAWGFGETKSGKKRQTCLERQACWWCDGREFRQIGKADIRSIVLLGSPSVPWAMWVTTSYKKHGSLRCRANTASRGIVGFDEVLVDCSNREAVANTWARLRAAQAAGISRPIIQNLDISPGHIAKIGWRVWRDFETWARPRLFSPLYALLLYLLPSREDIKDGYTD